MTKSPNEEFLKLVKKYLDGKASAEEADFIERYYEHFDNEPEIIDQLTESEIADLDEHLQYRITAKIKQMERPAIPLYRRKYIQLAAASLIFMLGGLLYFALRPLKPGADKIVVHKEKHDLKPGINKAILTLADGSKLILNQAKDGKLAKQTGVLVTKTGNQLSYKTNSRITGISYNTISIPRGGQYQLIVLDDQTKVWLNTASSLRFPTAFSGKERTVELTGEAYFEVAKDAARPFNVKTATQTVRVLGTHFNVNAYSDESAVKTTLLEGSVKVYSGNNYVLIKPGQQSVLNNNGLIDVKNDADINEIMAWKSGIFQFDDADIRTIMRQIGRWYDADVEFQGAIPASTYHGKTAMNADASQVLKILELSGINFTIEGRKIIVRP